MLTNSGTSNFLSGFLKSLGFPVKRLKSWTADLYPLTGRMADTKTVNSSTSNSGCLRTASLGFLVTRVMAGPQSLLANWVQVWPDKPREVIGL